MEGVIVNYRQGKHTQKDNHMVVEVQGYDSKDKASELVGKEAIFTSTAGKELKGKVASAHGNKGCVRVVFESGMPGQSLGKKVQLN